MSNRINLPPTQPPAGAPPAGAPGRPSLDQLVRDRIRARARLLHAARTSGNGSR